MKVISIISQQFTGYKRLQRKLPVNNLIQPWEFENLSFGFAFGLATNCTIKNLIACDMRPCSLLNTGQIVNCWYKDVIVSH